LLTVLAVKLLASPALIGLASLAGKRWGPNAAGLVGGLPLVGGPIVLVLWLTGGASLASQVASAAPAGVWATLVYLLVVGYASARWSWPWVIGIGWVCYLAAIALLNALGVAHSLVFGLAVLPMLLLAATRLLPRTQAQARVVSLPGTELFARMLAAAALVLGLTGAARLLGPDLTGLMSCAPVAATVIPAFTLANSGRDALLLALRGFLTGLLGFATFFLVLAPLIEPLGAIALLPALGAAIVAGLVGMRAVQMFSSPRRKPGSSA
jgi:hypothetical protein